MLAARTMNPDATPSEELLRRLWITAGLLAAAVILSYAPVFQAGFIWDDGEFITDNPHLRDLAGLKTIWTSPKDNPHYFPLLMTVFWLLYRLWGVQPLGYHLVTLGFHVANTLLVWLILRRLKVRAAVPAALLFGLHPLHVQSVAWATELKNTLSGFFYLGAIWTWLGVSEARLRGSGFRFQGWGGVLLCLVLFACALLSKTTVVSLPLAILLIEFWRRGRLPWRTVAFALALTVVAFLPVLVTVNLEQSRNVEGLSAVFTTGERWIVAGRSFWFYLGKLFWPADLMMVYPTWTVDPSRPAQYLPLAAAGLLGIGLWAGRRAWGRAPALGLLFFAAAVLPIPFLDINFVLQHAFVADHFAYLPSLGVLPVAAAALFLLPARLRSPRLRGALLAAPVLALGLLTWRHARTFENQGVLWRHVIERNPGAAVAYSNLGLYVAQQGDPVAAIDLYRKALELYPGSSKTWNNLATELRIIGREEEALAALQKAVELNPSYFEALNNLAALLSRRGRMDEAIAHLRRAIEVNPDYFEGHSNLGALLAGAGRHEEGIEFMRRALGWRPDDVQLLNNLARAIGESAESARAVERLRALAADYPDHVSIRLRLGEALWQAGDREAAEAEFAGVLRRAPSSAEILFQLGVIRQRLGDLEAALALFEQAVKAEPANAARANRLARLRATHPDAKYRDGARAVELASRASEAAGHSDPELLDTLAAAYAETGQFDEAQRMISLALRYTPPGAAREALEARRNLYEHRQPYRETESAHAP